MDRRPRSTIPGLTSAPPPQLKWKAKGKIFLRRKHQRLKAVVLKRVQSCVVQMQILVQQEPGGGLGICIFNKLLVISNATGP